MSSTHKITAVPVLDTSAPSDELVLEPEALLAAAAQMTGASHPGDDSFREPLAVILCSLTTEASLSPAGRAGAHGALVGVLARRMLLAADAARHPSILAERIERPLVITGLPRTGTTFLHGLLAQDPDVRVPMQWEVDMPSPPPEAASWATDPRIAQGKALYSQLHAALPDLRKAHPLDADLPAECINMFDVSLRSMVLPSTYSMPTYLEWLLAADPAPAFAIHRRMLQQLQWRGPKRRWVLKTPAYMVYGRGLWEAYPDACVVQTHRDPAKVLPSFSSLMRMFRVLYAQHVDSRALGRESTEMWVRIIERFLAARDSRGANDGVLDIQYRDLVANPMAVVARIYEHFGFELTPQAEGLMRQWLANHPQNKHGRHRYTPEEFGLEAHELRRRFAGYMARFAIPEEP
jgi:hypothetical protein